VTVAFGLVAAAMWAATDVINQRLARQVSPLAAMWAVMSLTLPVSIVLALVVDGVPRWADARPLGAGLLAGVLDAAAVGLFLRALRDGDLAIVAPLAALEGGFAALASLAMGAHLGGLVLAGIPLAVVGGSMAAMATRARLDRGAGSAIAAALIFAVVLVVLQTALEAGAMTAVAMTRIGTTVCTLPFAWRGGVIRPHTTIVWAAILAGTLDILGMAAYVHAADIGSLAVAAVSAAQFATLTVLIGVFALGERPLRHQWAGIALTLLGVGLLAYGSA
jgi:drug/metabolite transporter (DMT)-like permease